MFSYSEHPQSIGKVIDNGIRLLMSNFGAILGLALIGAVLTHLPNLLVAQPDMTNPAEAMDYVGVLATVSFLATLCAMVFFNAILVRLDGAARAQAPALGGSIGRGLKKTIPVFLAGILYMLAIVVGSILLIIPGLILMLSLVFYWPLIVVDDAGLVESLKSSHRLVWGNWWRTATVMFIPMVLAMALYIILGMVVGIAVPATGAEMDPDGVGLNLGLALVGIAVSTVTTPLFAAVFLTQLHDLKLRKQGLDLEQRIAMA